MMAILKRFENFYLWWIICYTNSIIFKTYYSPKLHELYHLQNILFTEITRTLSYSKHIIHRNYTNSIIFKTCYAPMISTCGAKHRRIICFEYDRVRVIYMIVRDIHVNGPLNSPCDAERQWMIKFVYDRVVVIYIIKFIELTCSSSWWNLHEWANTLSLWGRASVNDQICIW